MANFTRIEATILDVKRTKTPSGMGRSSTLKIIKLKAGGGYDLIAEVKKGWNCAGSGISEPVTLSIAEIAPRTTDELKAARMFSINGKVHKLEGSQVGAPLSASKRVWTYELKPTTESY